MFLVSNVGEGGEDGDDSVDLPNMMGDAGGLVRSLEGTDESNNFVVVSRCWRVVRVTR